MADNEIKLKLTLDGKEAIATIELTDKELTKLATSIRNAGNESRNAGEKLVHSFAQARNLIQGLKETYDVLSNLLSAPINLFVDDEQTRIAFEVLIGNAEKANEVLKELREYASKTPLEFTTLQESAKILLNYNISAKEIIPTLKMLGDISGGNAEKLRSLTLAFAQVQSTGRLTGQDLLQLINAGFNPLQAIAEKTGKTIAELKNEMEKGNISAEQIKQAFIDVTSEGGRFYGMLEKQSFTLGGKLSNLKDSISKLQIATGEFIGKALSPLLDIISKLISKITELSPGLAGLIGTITALTVAMVTLNATGITTVVKSILTGFIPAIKALQTSIASLEISLGPAGWLALGLSAIAGLWFSIAEGEQKAAENLEIYHSNFKKFRLAEINKLLNNEELDSTRRFLLEQERKRLLDEYIMRPHNIKEEEDSDKIIKQDFETSKRRLEIEQEHEMNMLKLRTDNLTKILILEKKHLEEMKNLYLQYGEDITEINYRIMETDTKLALQLNDVKLKDYEFHEEQKIQLKQLSTEKMLEIERNYAEQSKRITEEITEFDKWLYSEEATYKMQMQAAVLNFIASGYNQYTAIAKIAAMFNALLKAKEAYLTALAAFPPPFNFAAAAAVATAAATQIAEIAAMKPPRFEKGGRLKKGEIGFFEGYHDEIVAPEKTFVEVFRQELRPQIYGSNGTVNYDLSGIKESINKLNNLLDRGIVAKTYLDNKEAKKIYLRGYGQIKRSKI